MPRQSFVVVAALLLHARAFAGVPTSVSLPFAREESAAKAAAAALSADVCEKSPPSCAEAKKLLSAYETALAAATACDKGKCTLENVAAQAKTLAELDERDAVLPKSAGGTNNNAFLALSAIATSRLTAAETRLGSPYAALVSASNAKIEATKNLAGYCLADPTECGAMTALIDESKALDAKINACGPANCDLEAVDPLVVEADSKVSKYFTLGEPANFKTTPIFTVLYDVKRRGIAAYTPLADGALAGFAKDTEELGKKIDLAERDPRVPLTGIDAAGPTLLDGQRLASLGADRLSYFLGYNTAKNVQARREEVNAVVIRLSGLRARVFALRAARGLGEEKAGSGSVIATISGSVGGTNGTVGSSGVTFTPAPRTLLDKRLIPDPVGVKTDAPPILTGEYGYLELLIRSLSADPLTRADALRRRVRTKTVGDPGRYAPHAFTQDGDSSCAVAAQVEILRAHGLLPVEENPKDQERALVAEAKKLGYMDTGGTPPNYSGSLLLERGMLVDKHPHAVWADLETALLRGNVIQAGVDESKLWDIPSPRPLGHSILITGAEVLKDGGGILGVYINDSGTDPAGAGKFIPIGAFKAAWTNSFVEIR